MLYYSKYDENVWSFLFFFLFLRSQVLDLMFKVHIVLFAHLQSSINQYPVTLIEAMSDCIFAY